MLLKRISIIGLTCFLLTTVESQTIDTLWQNKPDISDNDKIYIFQNVLWDLSFKDSAKARSICEELLKITPAMDEVYDQSQAYWIAALTYQIIQDYTLSLEYYSKALQVCEQADNENGRELQGKILTNLGTLYIQNGDYQTSLTILLKADSLLEPFDLDEYRINLYSKIAGVYYSLDQADQGNNYYKKIQKIGEKVRDTLSIIVSNATYADYLISGRNFSEAEKKLNKALDLSIKIGNPDYIFNAYQYLGSLESQRNNFNKAIEYYKHAEEIAKGYNDYFSICSSLNEIGSIYVKTGKFNDARETLVKCMSMAREHGFKLILKNALTSAITLEDTSGNYKTAVNYYKEYDKLLQEVTNLDVRKTISFLDAKYQAQKRENDIIRLESQQKIHLIKLSRNRLWIIGLAALTLLVSTSLALILLNFSYKKKIIQQENDINKQKIAQLEKERQLTDTHAVLKGEEAERRRLARDLHDGLGGLLSGIKFNLTNMKGNFIITKENADQFDKALNLLDNSITELRRVAHNMMPEALVKYGLKDALSDFCYQMQDSEKRKISFQFYGEEKRVDNAIEISLYRIAQELLNNAFKHAKASEILVQLIQDEKRIHLTVQDNGTGFDITKVDPQKGAGLSNIKARVGSLNGQMEIDSKPGEGTEISVEFILI